MSCFSGVLIDCMEVNLFSFIKTSCNYSQFMYMMF